MNQSLSQGMVSRYMFGEMCFAASSVILEMGIIDTTVCFVERCLEMMSDLSLV